MDWLSFVCDQKKNAQTLLQVFQQAAAFTDFRFPFGRDFMMRPSTLQHQHQGLSHLFWGTRPHDTNNALVMIEMLLQAERIFQKISLVVMQSLLVIFIVIHTVVSPALVLSLICHNTIHSQIPIKPILFTNSNTCSNKKG